MTAMAGTANADALYRQAIAACEQGRLEDGVTLARAAIAADAHQVRFHRLLGMALGGLGLNDEALASFDRAIALGPASADVLGCRADVLVQSGRLEEAAECYSLALDIEPDSLDNWCNRGVVLMDLGRHDDALESLARAVALAPDFAPAHYNRGIACAALGRHHQAVASFDAALALDPGFVDALNNRGESLRLLGRLNEAEESFARALSIAPTHLAALYNRALVLDGLGHHDRALDAADRALELAPDNAQALYLRGKSLFALQRLREAADSYERAAQQGHGPATGLFGYCSLLACDWPGAARAAAMLDALPDDGSAVLTPFALLPFAIAPARHLKLLRGFLRGESAGVEPPARAHIRRTDDRIRIAYLSADFGDHAVTNLVAGLFERHDRNRFEIAGLSVGPQRHGVLRERIAANCDTFHELGLKADAEIAAEIAALGPDIIVDLTGYTENARPGILARRPAPIQVSYLGYLGTMGASYIDYVLADRIVLPFDRQPFYTERIVHLPDCFLVNDNTLAISPATPTRSEAGLPPDGLVFCSFNNSYKFQPPVFDIWMRLLRDIDRSVLWLLASNSEAVGNLRREAQARGVDPDRLIFAPRVEYADHLARQKLADIFLDTLPYNAGATGAGALWSGVPVLTAIGETFVGRMAASMLQSVGMPELATANLSDYEAMARALATAPVRLAAAKAKLARNRLTHALFDTDRSRRHIEVAYQTMWRIHRNGEPPRYFAVTPGEL